MGIRQILICRSIQETVSIQLISPTSGDLVLNKNTPLITAKWVSIQLISPPNGDSQKSLAQHIGISVSIQLISPTSGDWYIEMISRAGNRVSIQLISPTSGDDQLNDYNKNIINFPLH